MIRKQTIVALIVAFSLLIGIIPVSAAYSGTTTLNEDVYREAEFALFKFGIIDEYKGVIKPEYITRYEFVSMMVELYNRAGIELSVSSATFSDVPEGSSLAETLSKAATVGLIHGDSDSKFRSDDKLTESEALTIALNALGYNQVKKYLSSYYDYISIAYKLKLDKNLYSNEGYISQSDAYLLIYNMLNTEILQMESIRMDSNGFTGAQYANETGDTLLRSMFGIKRDEGIMVANEKMSLTTDDQLKENNYELLCEDNRKEIFVCETDEDYTSFIGMDVIVYYTENNDSGNKSIVHIAQTAYGNDYIDIDGSDVIGYDYSSRKLEYYYKTTVSELESKQKEKYARIPLDCNIVYNSYYVSDNKVVFDRINAAVEFTGNYNIKNIRLLDSDDDGDIDVLFVNMYINYLVERVTQDGEVMDYYTKDVIKLKDTDQLVIVKDENGNSIEYSTIAANDVLCIERDIEENKIVAITVVRNSTAGILQGKSDSYGYSFTINDEKLPIANGAHMKKIYDTVQLSGNYIIYFDICGNVAGFNISDESMKYGYILASGTEGGALSARTLLRMCVPDQSEYGHTVSNYEVREKVKIDGYSEKASEYNFQNLEFKLIRFRTNASGEITVIDTPSDTRGSGEFSYVNYKEAAGPVDTLFRPNWTMLIESSSTVDDKVSANFAVDSNTIMMAVPVDDDVTDAELRIARIETMGEYFQDFQNYQVHGYVLDEGDIACRVLLVLISEEDGEAVKKMFSRQRVFVVDDVAMALNNEGVPAVLIRGIEAKKRMAYTSTGTQIVDYDTGKNITVNEGDVLQIMTNAHGDIKAVRRLYNAASDSYGKVPYAMYVGTDPRVVVGSVFSTNGKYFTMIEKTKPRTWEYAEVFCCNGDHNVYVYDGETGEVKLGSYNDIVVGEETRVVTWCATSSLLDIVVYKNMDIIN